MAESRAYSVNHLLDKKFDTMPFEGRWENSFGQPSKQFSAIFYGGSGEGKTDLAIQFGKYLTKFGKVAYNSIEEGISQTLKMAMQRNHINQVADKFQIYDKLDLQGLTKKLKKQRSPDYIIVDSVQYLNANTKQYMQFKNEFSGKKAFIYISHVDGNKLRGSLAKFIWYDVDIHVPVKGFKAFPAKRLNGGGEPFVINEKRAAAYHGEIK